MEPNKFDKQIKEKMEARIIMPSSDAWEKLEAMMVAAEKPKRNYSWLYIAASFVGLLIVSSIFFNQNKIEPIKTNVEVVVKEAVVPKATVKPIVILLQQIQKRTLTSDKPTNIVAVISKSTKIEKVPAIFKKNPIAEVSIINQKSPSNLVPLQPNEVSVDELLTSVSSVSVKENRISQTHSVYVNANKLLSQVDGELELTFREKLINKVSKNYQAVKVALDNRNLE